MLIKISLFNRLVFFVSLWKLFIFVDINECESNPCENGGTCTDMKDGYMCECESGFTGSDCKTGNN